MKRKFRLTPTKVKLIFYFYFRYFVSKMSDCNICITKYNKSVNKEVKCLYCNYSCCLTCVKKMMIDIGEECPDCKKGWSKEFIRENTPKVWFDGEYKQKRKEAMFEREKALLQSAIPILKVAQYSDKMKKEISELTAKIKELEVKKNHFELELRHNTARLRNGLEIEEVDEEKTVHELSYTGKRVVTFIKACPVNECRGFLSTAWKCEVCETWVCKDCHEIKNGKNDDEHKCNEDSVKSAELLMKETKPCPRCSARIYKIEGCNSMFCTSCKTCFSWKSGNISKSNSNPHFHEWSFRNGKTEAQIVERGCYNWVKIRNDLHNVIINIFKGKTPQKYDGGRIANLIRMCDHIQDTILPRFMTNQVEDAKLLKYRVQYLKNEITPEVWKKNIFMIEKKFEYDTTIYNLYEVVSAVIRQTISKMSTCKNEGELKDAFNEIGYVVNYFNSNSEKKSKEFGYGGYDFIGYDPEGSIGGRLKDYHITDFHIMNRYSTSNYFAIHFSFEYKKHPVNKRVKDTYPYLEQEEEKKEA